MHLFFTRHLLSFRYQGYQGDDHFFERDASMLECVLVIVGVVVKVVRVCEKIAVMGKHITSADIS